MTMTFDETPQFKRDLKKSKKKHPSLSEDLLNLRGIIEFDPIGQITGYNNRLTKPDTVDVRKIRLACKSLKGSSRRYRVVFGYHEHEQHIGFIELYFETDTKTKPDEKRIEDYLKNFK